MDYLYIIRISRINISNNYIYHTFKSIYIFYMNKKYLFLSIFLWSLVGIASLFWNINQIKSNTAKIAENKGVYIFSSIKLSRLWNSNHGGVYVPITEETEPNPYLEDPNKIVETTNGLKLTKINPAYMTRQMSELAAKGNDYQFHLTSLKPIRPANKADQWETKALQKFEKEGANSYSFEKIESENNPVFRYMAPLSVEKSCLNCHEKQGYKLGDIRGGISVTFPSTFSDVLIAKTTNYLFYVHLFIFIIGLLVLIVFNTFYNRFYNIILGKNNELTKSNDAKKKMFSIIAHDLKSPFNSLLGFSDLLIENFNNYSDEEKFKIIHILSDTSKNTYNLLENLLTWSRTQINQIECNPVEISVKELYAKIGALLENIAKQKNIALVFSELNEVSIFADKDMVETVFRNLILNAVKFTYTKGTITVSHKTSSDSNFVEFSVSDTGVGMTDKQLVELFKVGENSSTTGTAKETGTGLGLLICKDFIEQNGGEIWATSEINKGSQFKFTLPKYFKN